MWLRAVTRALSVIGFGNYVNRHLQTLIVLLIIYVHWNADEVKEFSAPLRKAG
jgi:hypothetical protein